MLVKRLAGLFVLVVLAVLAFQAPRVSAVPSGPVDMKLLVITGDGSEPSFSAATVYLDRIGIPHDVLIATDTTLTPSLLGDGSKGYYQGIVLATGSLSYEVTPGVWESAFDPAEWQTLWAYEAQYGVRQLAYYAYPGEEPDDFGLSLVGTVDTGVTPLEGILTDLGRDVFDYLNPGVTVPIRYAWTYLSALADAQTEPLLTTPGGDVLAAIHTYDDGRETLVMTMDHESHLLHSLLLNYGALRWVAGGVFLGERHVYLSPQVDDIFFDNDLWDPVALSDETGLTYRMTGDDLTAVDNWQTSVRSTATGADFRLEFAYNGEGTEVGEYPGDTLTPAARLLQGHFAWLNHTWSHPNLDGVTDQEFIRQEINLNRNLLQAWNFTIFSPNTLLTGDVSGLANPIFIDVAYDEGIEYLICDTSLPASCSAPFNTAVPNPIQPAVLMMPRYPTDIFYSSSTPLEQTSRYNFIYHDEWGRDLTYEEIVEWESDVYLRRMLSYDMYPLMFHQANLRAYDGVNSLLSDVIGRAFEKYNQYFTLPVQTLTLAELGPKTEARAAYDNSGVTATLDLVDGMLTIDGSLGDVIPVTGISMGLSVEIYGGEPISYVTLPTDGPLSIPILPPEDDVIVIVDRDGDGFDDFGEAFMGTDHLAACPISSTANDEDPDAWPPDLNDDQTVNILDVIQLAPPVFRSQLGDDTYARRADLVPDGVINILDLVQFTPPTFNTRCM